MVVKENEVSITSPAADQRVNTRGSSSTRGWIRTYFALACRPQIVWMDEAKRCIRYGEWTKLVFSACRRVAV